MGEYPRFYFGYGSNLDITDFKRYCLEKSIVGAELTPICAAHLTDHVMQFHYYSRGRKGGAADVIVSPAKGFAVPGVLFEPNEVAWKVLDAKEGHPKYYARKVSSVACENLVTLKGDCATYMVIPDRIKKDFQEPTNEYVDIIRRNLEAEALNLAMLNSSTKRWIAPMEEEANIKHCFVYGTLRKTEIRENKMKTSNRVKVHEKAFVFGNLFDVSGNYPALVPLSSSPERVNESRKKVFGELHEFSGNMHQVLKTLDEIEGCFPNDNSRDDLYNRVVTKVYLEGDVFVWAWIYVYNQDVSKYEMIDSGDWVTHRNAKIT